MEELENEEEVMLRHDEFKQHALYSRLKEYSSDMKDYIEEKKQA